MLNSKILFVFTIALALGLSACGKKTSKTATAPAPSSSTTLQPTTTVATALQGTWAQGCNNNGVVNFKEVLTFQYNLMTDVFTTYSDALCTQQSTTQTYQTLFTLSGSNGNLQIAFTTGNSPIYEGESDVATVTTDDESSSLVIQDGWFMGESFSNPAE